MSDSDSDDDGLAMLERILSSPNAESLRQFVVDQLRLRPDESVLSIGCGPGFETAALADEIDGRGRVHGIDTNAAVLARADDRCADRPQVSFVRGDATDLPVSDDRYDVAVAKQVYQYVDDIETALRELYRVLAPGGRALVVEKDVDTMMIHSSDCGRMRRAIDAYRKGVPHPNLGIRLVAALPEAGFTVDEIVPRASVQTEITPQVERGLEVQRSFMAADESFDRATIEAWERDLRDLEAAGKFCSVGTQFCYLATKPASESE